MRKLSLLISMIIFISGYAAGGENSQNLKLSPDGPYIFQNSDGSYRIIRTDTSGKIIDTVCTAITSFSVTDSQKKYSFTVPATYVNDNITEPDYFCKQADSVFVVSDPHGRFDLLADLLISHHIIDTDLMWNFGKNHLVVLGDVFDRGDDVTQILWFLFKLEREASRAGGRVSFLLGNHEAMVLSGDIRYATEKYKALADTLDIPLKDLYGNNAILGKWLAKRNTIEFIGHKYLLVHAGLSEDFLAKDYQLPFVNQFVGKHLFYSKKEKNEMGEDVTFIFGNKGPLWYRGLVKNEEKYSPITEDALKKILCKYGVNHIIVGHTIMDNVQTFHKGRVYAVNVNNEKNFSSNQSRGLLITKKGIYKIYNKICIEGR